MKLKEVVITHHYSGEEKEVQSRLTAKQAKLLLGARKNSKAIPKPRSLMGEAVSKSSNESNPSLESGSEKSNATEAAPSRSSASVQSSSSETGTDPIASSSTMNQVNMSKPRGLLDMPNQVPKPRLDSYKIGHLYDPLNIRPTQWRQRTLEHITIEKIYAPRNEREEEARYIRRLSAANGKTLDFCYHNGQGHVFYQSMQPQTGRISYYHNMNTGKKVSWDVSPTGARAKKGKIEQLPPTPIKGYKKK